MRTLVRLIVLAGALCAVCAAQKWEIGGYGGAQFLDRLPLTSVLGSAKAGFDSQAAVGGFLGHRTYAHVSGELHYSYFMSDLRLESGGTVVNFKGQAQAVHYDLVIHTGKASKKSRVEAFLALGGGVKMFQGTGHEQAYQPLSQFAFLTKTRTFKPMASAGGGLRFGLSRHVFLRTEFRDYITAFPKAVITPAPGVKVGNLLQDLVPMVGLSIAF
jgi:hypothetical protein